MVDPYKLFKYSLANIAVIVSIPGLGERLYGIADQMRGQPFADVGVVMYEHSGRAWLFWLVSFLSSSCFLIFMLKHYLSRESSLPFWFGGITILLCLPWYLFALAW